MHGLKSFFSILFGDSSYPDRFLDLSLIRQAKIIKNPVLSYFHRLLCADLFKKLTTGRRVLILGSGPSALELQDIPEDVALFTCNAGLKFIVDRRIQKPVDLYYYHKRKSEWAQSGIKDDLLRVEIRCFISNLISAIRAAQKSQDGKQIRTTVIRDFNRNNFYLKSLISPLHPVSLAANGIQWTTAGVRLLQYALYFEAKEVYLAGIDQTDDYFWGSKSRSLAEDPFEKKILGIISKKFKNIFSLSANSPITRYFPVRHLEECSGERSRFC
ncbi:MAG: hypothetical protein HYZ52_04230 [Candidatus Omnitrophica bacterium]|nr:hypothetical protein [Candidatus Omnitrophota bacterium]